MIKLDKQLKILIGLVILVIIFIQKIEYIYFKYVKDLLLVEVKSSKINDLIFLLPLFIIPVFFYNRNKYKPIVSLNQLFLCLTIIAFYLYYRLLFPTLFKSFTFYKSFKYFDTLFLYFLIPIVFYFLSFFRKKKGNSLLNNFLYEDAPIINSNQDLLNRVYKAENIYNEICLTKADHSIAIGITGEWGSGKTSFLNILKKKFNTNEEFVVINFNPWLNITVESIIKDFFNTLDANLKNFSSDLSRELNSYSDLVLNVYKNSFLEILEKTFNIVFESNLTDKFHDLNNLLQKLDKRVLIVIDDFDRLQANEIFEILKLIRNTAGFDSFIYIVAYDKEYLNESLKNFNIPKPNSFSDKIFLKEERLLPVTHLQIDSFISAELKKGLTENNIEIENFFSKKNNKTLPLMHLRDAKRFLNIFIHDFKRINEEVLFSDYFNLKLLKFKYYDVYVLLFLYKDRFLKLGDDKVITNKRRLILKYVDKPQFSKNTNFDDSELGKYLSLELNLSLNDKQNIFLIVEDIFGYKHQFGDRDKLSIVYSDNYFLYFKDALDETGLSDVEFNESLKLSLPELKEKIDEWSNSNKLVLVIHKFYEFELKKLKDVTQYEIFIKAIFYICNLNTGDYSLSFAYSDFELKIENYQNNIVKQFYQNNIERFKIFVKGLFNDAPFPYVYPSNFLNYLYKNSYGDDNYDDKERGVSREDMEIFLIMYLKKYLDSVVCLDYNVWTLFHNCNIVIWESGSRKNNYFPQAKKLLIEFMKKDLDSFLVEFVKPQDFYMSSPEDNKVGLSLSIKNIIFGSYEDFIKHIQSEEFLDSLSQPSEFYDEFLRFAKEFVYKGEVIEFDFTYQPIIDKLKNNIR